MAVVGIERISTEDAQGAWETMFNLQGAIRGGANIILHSAAGRKGSGRALEKLILDVEILHTIVESWQPIDMSADELAFDAIAGVEPVGTSSVNPTRSSVSKRRSTIRSLRPG